MVVKKKFGFIILSLFLLISIGVAKECGESPSSGCLISKNTIFKTGFYYLEIGIGIQGHNLFLDCNNSIIYGGDLVGGPEGSYALTLTNISNLTIRNCIIEGYGKQSAGIFSSSNSKNVLLDNMIVKQTNGAFSFSADNGDENITISNSYFMATNDDKDLPSVVSFSAMGSNIIYNTLFDIDTVSIGGEKYANYHIYNNTFLVSYKNNNMVFLGMMHFSNITHNYFGTNVVLGKKSGLGQDQRIKNSFIYGNLFDGKEGGSLIDYVEDVDSKLYYWDKEGGTFNVSYCYNNTGNNYVNGAYYLGKDIFNATCTLNNSILPEFNRMQPKPILYEFKLDKTYILFLRLFNFYTILTLILLFSIIILIWKNRRNYIARKTLRAYIIRNLNRGYSRKNIESKLLLAGWPKEMIKDVFKKI